VLYSLFLQTSLIGIGLKVLTTFLLCHTTLMHTSTLKWVNLFLFIYLSYFPYILLINFLNAFWFLNQLTWICGVLKSCWGCYLSGISNYWYILVIKCCILAVSFYFHQLLIYVPPFFILFAGREGYRKRNSSLAPTCHLGANAWTKKSCLLKRWLHYSSSICSSIENATHLIPEKTPRSIFVYFRGLFYDVGNDPEGGLSNSHMFKKWLDVQLLQLFSIECEA
jgi:hypothetical protein